MEPHQDILVMDFMSYILLIIIVIILVTILLTPRSTLQSTDESRQTELRKLLVNVASSFNDHDMYYWVDFGTLLGIIREDDIIRHDNDVDLCINDDEESHKKMLGPITDRLNASGYRVTKETWKAYRVWKSNIFVDIYITNVEGDTIKGDPDAWVDSHIPSALIGTPKNIYWKLAAIHLKAPENIHEVLVWRYGSDYMTPKQGFNEKDNKNKINNRLL